MARHPRDLGDPNDPLERAAGARRRRSANTCAPRSSTSATTRSATSGAGSPAALFVLWAAEVPIRYTDINATPTVVIRVIWVAAGDAASLAAVAGASCCCGAAVRSRRCAGTAARPTYGRSSAAALRGAPIAAGQAGSSLGARRYRAVAAFTSPNRRFMNASISDSTPGCRRRVRSM